MRHIMIDFNTSPIEAGYLGEHNATEIVIVKPVDLSGDMYSVAFMTNGEVVHSRYFSGDEEIRVALWQQLTQDNDLFVQLEAYDGNGDYLGKSSTVKLLLSNSVHGIDVIADTDNPDVYSEVAQNSWFRETLEDNVETLDKLSTSALGDLLFDGKPVGSGSGGGGISDELYQEIVANTEKRHWHDNKNVLDKFGISNNGLYPTFKANALTEAKQLAYLDDVVNRDNSLHRSIPAKAVVEGSRVTFKNGVGVGTDLFSFELPESGGSGGGDGFSPIVEIEEIEGGHRITITDANGTESFDVLNGKDYVLTNADKTEIANAVIEALPKYNGEVAEV